MKWKRLAQAAAMLLAAMMIWMIPPWLAAREAPQQLPGMDASSRQLLRLWVTGSPGGGMKWLRAQLAAFEKANPGVMTYVRQITPDALDDDPPPGILLFMPGDVTDPSTLLIPMTGALQGEESLLRAGRWRGQQYAIPLCWSGWALAIDSQFDDAPSVTPAPTTLLGKPAPTANARPTVTPGFPAGRASEADTPLIAPMSAGQFSLRSMLGDATLPMDQTARTSQQVYEAFLARKSVSALLTTGQIAALNALQSAGRGFPCRVITPETVVTDQVWMAGMTKDDPTAAALIAYLTEEKAQRALTGQSLHSIDLGMPLYAEGVPGLMESAARRGLAAINAFIPRETVTQAAWQAYTGAISPDEALPPLL